MLGCSRSSCRGHPVGSGWPQNSACWLMTALCVGGSYDDNNNVANGGTDQSTDGATYIIVFAHARNVYAAAVSRNYGERGHGHTTSGCR
jgi:hypothetical protein